MYLLLRTVLRYNNNASETMQSDRRQRLWARCGAVKGGRRRGMGLKSGPARVDRARIIYK